MDKIICLGKNYLEHAHELGDAVPEKPVLFLKPPSVLRLAPGNSPLELRLPPRAGQAHHECEVVLRLGRGGSDLSQADAESAIADVSLGLDMTLRDRQALLKKNGHPWEISKVFRDSAVAGPWVATREFPDWMQEEFRMEVGGKLRQKGRVSQMRMSPAECVAYASEYFPLCEGDLVFTGTPAGVGPIAPGDTAVLSWGPIRYEVTWS